MRFKFLIFLLVLVNASLIAQDLEKVKTTFLPDRAPLFMKWSIVQKSFTKAQMEFDLDGADFNVKRSHSIGAGVGLEFAFNNPPDYNGMWTLSTNFLITSYSLNFSGIFNAEDFGLDEDAHTTGKFYAPALEGSFMLRNYRQLENGLILVLGAGINVQNIELRNSSIRAFSRVAQNGAVTTTEVLNNDRHFFNFERTRHNLNFTWSAGISKRLGNGQLIQFDLRFCTLNKDGIDENLDSSLGGSAKLTALKSFTALEISYLYSVNQKRRKKKRMPY
jgi:hypothetical protein